MTNLTIALDEAVVRQARVRAIQQGTSLSAKVREFLATYAAGVSQDAANNSSSELLRLMALVRTEIQANEKLATTAQPDNMAEAAPDQTLRETMYPGDFRARARLESTPQPTPDAKS